MSPQEARHIYSARRCVDKPFLDHERAPEVKCPPRLDPSTFDQSLVPGSDLNARVPPTLDLPICSPLRLAMSFLMESVPKRVDGMHCSTEDQ